MVSCLSDPDARPGRRKNDFRDRHHNEAKARGGAATRQNLVLLWRRAHHEPFTRLFGLFTFYEAFGALSHGAKIRRWLASGETLNPARLGTVMGRMRHSRPLRRIVNFDRNAETESGAETLALLRLLFSSRNFAADGTPDLARMARVMRRLHEKHEAWARAASDREATARVIAFIDMTLRRERREAPSLLRWFPRRPGLPPVSLPA